MSFLDIFKGRATSSSDSSDDIFGFFAKQYSNIHLDPDQVKRQKSACKLHVVSIDSENFTGVINDYDVTLSSCKCVDFGMRQLPCKHIYRLAYELGIFHLTGKIVNDKKMKSSRQIEAERTIRQSHTFELSDDEIYLLDSYRNLSIDNQIKLCDYVASLGEK